MSCVTLDESECNRKVLSCEWRDGGTGEYGGENGSCRNIRSSVALQLKRQEQREAKGGWLKIMIFVLVGIVILFYAIQQVTGLPTFDVFTASETNQNISGATYTIVFGVFAIVIGALYTLLKRCDFSFACFLLGGEAGLTEQPVEEARYRKYARDKLKKHFLEGGQTTTYDTRTERVARVRPTVDFADEIGDDMRHRDKTRYSRDDSRDTRRYDEDSAL
jgi:hypothetical protein